ncbi:MAG: mandelate racemase/muconate lactonizing enzyme family protein [Actinomycetota bacterium]
MRITEVEVIPLALPLEHPYVTASGTLERREMILLRLQTEVGVVGLGEAVPLSLRGGDTPRRVERSLIRLTRRLAKLDAAAMASEEPLAAAVDAVIHVAAGRRLPPPAKAAVEMALFDLAGRLSGTPLWRMLRGESSAPLRCNATLAADSPQALAAETIAWRERGFETFKLKLGIGDDVKRARAVREAVGPEARIRVDANGAWSTEQAVAILNEIEPLGIELVEQPTGSLREMAAVAEATAIPIAADESVTSAKEAQRAVRVGACRLATVKLAKVGGIGTAAGIAAELPVYLSSALDGPVGIAAAAHAAQALYRDHEDPGLAHGLATQELFAGTIASVECELREGFLHLPEGPGLGVEIDEAALERHRL